MLKKQLRLKTKDVKFLTRKGGRYYGTYFSLHSFLQYPNIPHNQISCHISIKYDKRAVHRNTLKKIILQYIQDNKLIHKKRNNKHYKIFIGLNKKTIPKFKQILEEKDKKDTRKTIHRELELLFKYREYRLLSPSSRRYEKNTRKN